MTGAGRTREVERGPAEASARRDVATGLRRLAWAVCVWLVVPTLGVAVEDESGEAAEVESTLATWRDTLRFGIDSEILELIGELDRNREVGLNAELVALAEDSANPDVVRAIIEMFRRIEDVALAQKASDIVAREGEAVAGGTTTRDGRQRSLLTAAIYYLGDLGQAGSAELMRPLLEHEDTLVATAAIAAIGGSGGRDEVPDLLERLDDLAFPADLKPELLLALGAIGAESAVERLEEVVADTANPRVWRMYASDSLGKIGAGSSLPVLRAVLSEDDPQLKAYAASAIGQYDSSDANDALIAGLRDGHWSVREASAMGLGRTMASDAVDILRYKAERDPEEKVRLAAIDALAQIGAPQSRSYLQETAGADDASLGVRDRAVRSIIRHDLEASTAFLEEMIDAEWGRSPPTLLMAMAQELAEHGQASLQKFYERFLGSVHPGIRVYGIRGIARGELRGMRNAIEALRVGDGVAAVRVEAELALQKLGGGAEAATPAAAPATP